MKALFIDLWGTIIYPKVPLEAYYRSRAEELLKTLLNLGYSVGYDDVLKALITSRKLTDVIRSKTNIEVKVEGDIVLFLKELGLEDFNLVDKLVDAYMRPYINLTTVASDINLLVEFIEKYSIKTAIISNTMHSPSTYEVLRRNNILNYFSIVILSDEIGLRKPDPRVFYKALAELRVTPDEAVMVGDEEDDILGAKNVGITTIAYEGFHGYEGVEPDYIARSYREVIELLYNLL